VKRDEAVSAAMLNQERLESLVKISQRRTENTQELLDFALEEAIRLTRSKIGYIYFYNEEKREFTLNTWSREVMQACTIAEPQTIYQLEKTGIWGEAARQRKPIVVQDFHAPHPLKKGYPPGHVPLRSFLTVPLFQQDRIVAVVGVANKETIYGQDDISQLTLLMDAVWRMAEIKQIETALRKNEAVLRSFLNAVTESALLMDREGRVLAANETLANRFGTTVPEVVGRCIYDLLPSAVAERRKGHLDKVCITGKPDRFEDERQGRVIDNSVYPVFDPQGAVIALAVIGIDITERKRVVSALEISEEKYRMLYDSAIDAIFIADVDGKIIDVNRTAHERLGYAREEMLALHVSRLDPPDYAVQVGVRIEQLQQQGHLIFESAHRRKDGTIMPVEINARIIDYDGRKAIFSIIRDITDRKLAEQEREKLIAELQQALAEIKTLHGILPICSSCKKIRDDKGAWQHLETYISQHTDAEFTHGLCADCAIKLYPEYMNKKA
jgi:PAS domain S-box-containing protein